MLELYTDRARLVWFTAILEARATRSREVSNEHILLAILRQVTTPGPGADRCVIEEACLAGIVLHLAEIDPVEFERRLRADAPRVDLKRIVVEGPNPLLDRGARQSLRHQLSIRRGRHGLVIDTAQQLLSSIGTSRSTRRAYREVRPRRNALRPGVKAIKAERARLDAQARSLFTATELRAWTK